MFWHVRIRIQQYLCILIKKNFTAASLFAALKLILKTSNGFGWGVGKDGRNICKHLLLFGCYSPLKVSNFMLKFARIRCENLVVQTIKKRSGEIQIRILKYTNKCLLCHSVSIGTHNGNVSVLCVYLNICVCTSLFIILFSFFFFLPAKKWQIEKERIT